MTLPQVGEPAPETTLPQRDASLLNLESLRPGQVVVFFFPRADTPGCTTESIDFTASLDDFAAVGTQVVGISKDAPAAMGRFADKSALGVILLSDETSDCCERWGVWGQKSMYGKTFTGVLRTTFLLDSNGRIARIWENVKVPGHAEEVLSAARALAEA